MQISIIYWSHNLSSELHALHNMASVTTEFKFVDVNNPSKGPPFESWERHKAPILQKYATMCLRDVKISMEEEFQFFAT